MLRKAGTPKNRSTEEIARALAAVLISSATALPQP
jgi:hypothetical protein